MCHIPAQDTRHSYRPSDVTFCTITNVIQIILIFLSNTDLSSIRKTRLIGSNDDDFDDDDHDRYYYYYYYYIVHNGTKTGNSSVDILTTMRAGQLRNRGLKAENSKTVFFYQKGL